MSVLGLYFGPQDIGLVNTKGNKALGYAKISRALLGTGGLEVEEKVPFEVKMVAALKEELRKANIEAKEAAISLSGADLIIRTFEMPVLPREEMAGAVNFEAKKYIPFKIEELITDYQAQFDRISRKNQVLFVGIKKETLEKYVSTLHQLNIKVIELEYAAFSLFRAMKVAGLNEKGVVAVLGADLNEDDEVSFTVLEEGFPLFSRDISLGAGPDELAGPQGGAAPEPGMMLEKLKTEVRVSLDYYHRKFPAKNIQRLFFAINPQHRKDLEGLLSELGLASQFVDTAKFFSGPQEFSLVGLKAFSAAISRTVRTPIRTNLLLSKHKTEHPKAKPIKIEAISLKELKVDPRMAILGLLICLASFGLGVTRTMPLRKELQDIIAMRPQVAKVGPQLDYAQLTGTSAEYKKKLNKLNALVKKQFYLTSPLDAIPRCLPKGAWLMRLGFQRKEREEKADLTLEGATYLADSNKELEAVNEFLRSLKANPGLKGYFKDISLVSIERKPQENITLTAFNILCKADPEERK